MLLPSLLTFKTTAINPPSVYVTGHPEIMKTLDYSQAFFHPTFVKVTTTAWLLVKWNGIGRPIG
jgi:hypothetical protein